MTINTDRQSKTNNQALLTDDELAAIELIDTLLVPPTLIRPSTPLKPVVEVARNWVGGDLAENRKNGHTAQARRAIDEHRKGEGKDEYNASRRGEYRGKVMAEEHRRVRPYRVPDSPEKRTARNLAKNQSKKLKRAARTPDQVILDRAEDTARRAKARAKPSA